MLQAANDASERMRNAHVRLVEVPDCGTFEVPRHVSRVDSFKTGANGQRVGAWHGWQVRWPGYSRFFSDAANGGCAAALQAASRHTQQHYPGRRSQCKPDAGVRLVEIIKPTRQFAEVYVEVTHPARGRSPRRLYVGTERTVTAQRIERKIAEARRIRAEFVRTHQQRSGTRSDKKPVQGRNINEQLSHPGDTDARQ